MKTLLDAATGLCRVLTGIAFAVLIVAVLTQVVGRTIIQDSPVWTEELTRFALLFLAALGVGPSLRSGDLVNVDIVCEALPGVAPKVLRIISALLTAGLCAVLIMPAWQYTSIGAFQTSPALGWRMDFIHASVLVMLASLGVFALLRAVAIATGAETGRPEGHDDDMLKTETA